MTVIEIPNTTNTEMTGSDWLDICIIKVLFIDKQQQKLKVSVHFVHNN